MKKRKYTRRVIFHHSLTTSGNVNSIRKYHIEHNKYVDIGYHYVITPDGTIETGRHISLVGAHAFGRNNDSIGVCLVGDFRIQVPKTEQITACINLLHDLKHVIMDGWIHPLKIEFHRPSVFNLFEVSSYWRFDSCPGAKLHRAVFVRKMYQAYE